MEGSKLFHLLLLLIFVSGAYAWCAAWNEAGALRLCQEKGHKKPCDNVKSEDKCVNLDREESWASGAAIGGDAEMQCTIFSKHDCKGTSVSVDHKGWPEFPIKPKSFKCPCVSSA